MPQRWRKRIEIKGKGKREEKEREREERGERRTNVKEDGRRSGWKEGEEWEMSSLSVGGR
jgi:hypothetical protein